MAVTETGAGARRYEREFGAGTRERLAAFLARETESAVTITRFERLGGGAIQDNRRLDIEIARGPLAGSHALVLRASRPARIAFSHGRAHEFALLRAAWAAGVMVPEPLWLCADAEVIGTPFFIMRFVSGTALGHKIVRDSKFYKLREKLVGQLGEDLARIHSIAPSSLPEGIAAETLDFLAPPSPAPAPAAIAAYRRFLDEHPLPHPVIEWGLSWADAHCPEGEEIVLCHHDFRTGNYLVDPARAESGGLAAILDWEFAGWGAPMSDIGWFCAKCWRFRAHKREAGGLAPRAPFYDGYTRVSGRSIDDAAVRFWEVMDHVRWAVIAIAQCERHLSGDEPSVELAAIGRRIPEMELEILHLTGML